MSELLGRFSELPPAKRRVVLQRLREKRGERSTNRIQPLQRHSDTFPLSFAQQRLWFLNQFDPESAAYNLPTALRLKGSLNFVALKNTFSEIVRRHEVLRTIYTLRDGEPVQVIAAPVPLTPPVQDLSGLPVVEREVEVRRLAGREAWRPFRPDREPPLRVGLLRLGDEEYVLLVTIHHIASDAWSRGILIQEVGTLYSAFSQGRPSPLLELPIQYADFAHWQRQWLQGELLEAQLAYWKRRLGDAPAVLDLPTDRPRPTVQCAGGESKRFALSKALSGALDGLGRQQGCTLFMTLMAVFQMLLQRYTGQEDLCVGTPIAGRHQLETEGLIGFFVNTLVIRTDLSDHPGFRLLLARVRDLILEAHANQDLPFERLVEELQPERNLSHTPLFQVMFTFQNSPREALELADLEMSYLGEGTPAGAFDWSLTMAWEGNWLVGSLGYNPDLFEAATAARFVGHFQTLAEGVCAHPEHRFSGLPMLTEGENQQLRVEWNDTRAQDPRARCVQQLFEAQVEQTPTATAMVLEGERLTYENLNLQANQLAHHLRTLGVGPDVMVGICAKRSLELMVAVLGVLKAGGAYLPLDPGQPTERLAFMLNEAEASLVLTQESLTEILPEGGVRAICLDRDWQVLARSSQQNPTVTTVGQNLACVLYTSGSTGRPKGVAITHGGIVALVQKGRDFVSPEELTGLLSTTQVFFSCSVFEFFVPLSSGGTLILAENALHLPKLSGPEQVSLINIVPSAIAELLPTGGLPSSVRTVNLQGDFPSSEVIRRLYQTTHIHRVFNGYGATEVTTYAMVSLLPRELSGPISIGRPLAGTVIYLLDRNGGPVPIGVPGEVCFTGTGLARGYLGRPGLTAEKFLPDPLSSQRGERLYKTGDLGRYLLNGETQILGRIDRQVKIRGFRVELEEIEETLARAPDVDKAVVLAWEDRPGTKSLTAYVVPAGERQVTVTGLRSYLLGRLPDYLVPTAFVVLETLPLNKNGKVDRKALPVPDGRRPEQGAAFVAPRTATEQALAGIWSEVLGIELVGAHDNFFDLGGHSLLIIQVVSRIHATFAVELTLREFFGAPTIENLAQKIEEALVTRTRSERVDEVLDLLEAMDEQEAERMLAVDDALDHR